MRRPVATRLLATGVAAALATAVGVSVLTIPAQAATGAADGFASQNGGTTGGAGGRTVRATTGTQIHEALCGRASSSTPIVIEVSGTVNHANTAKVSGSSCSTAAGVIELKQVSNVTLVGVGSGAVFDQVGIHIREARNIIVQNVTVRNVKKSGSPTSNGGDAIGMESGVSNVWVDHVTLEASGGESEGYDGLFDMKGDTRYVTLSYSILRNSGRGGLVGSGDSDLGNGPVTYHHNLYENLDSRVPLLRGATAHIFNNHYVGIKESGINARAGGRAKVDNNYFEDSKDVLGTFYTDLPGYWQVSGNVFDDVTWSSRGSDTNPAGPNVTSTTTVSVPYSYRLDGASCVPALVRATAGANKGNQVSNGSCTPQSPAPTAAPTSAPTTGPTAGPIPSAQPSTPTPTAPPVGRNLSLGAGADGSGKGGGTSYGNAIDGSLSTYWQPNGSTGRISVKWGSATTVARVVLREPAGSAGSVGAWRVVDNSTGAVLATGDGAGTLTFRATSLTKLNVEILASTGTPRVAEVETYAG
ncbi:polysaccharide lyase family 1 protein [Cellulomonas sp. KH9]|uniref:pectate lyase family protein n=1 Tax=Cellulomonas sp. KH9 TaxID=1855324 RepID=UPI0008F24126|nr:polysaccharide lyase family 1 protein [Cellulomonas sp. KH9]SFK05561.1 Pectate lyase [Cellulomonas sp. KH9]